MPKKRMTEAEKEFYNKMLNVIKAGVKVEALPGPVWNKWVNLHFNKTF